MSRWYQHYTGKLAGVVKDYPVCKKIRQKIRNSKKSKDFFTADVEWLITANCFRENAYKSCVLLSDTEFVRIVRFAYKNKRVILKESNSIQIKHYCNFLAHPIKNLGAYICGGVLCNTSPVEVVRQFDM